MIKPISTPARVKITAARHFEDRFPGVGEAASKSYGSHCSIPRLLLCAPVKFFSSNQEEWWGGELILPCIMICGKAA